MSLVSVAVVTVASNVVVLVTGLSPSLSSVTVVTVGSNVVVETTDVPYVQALSTVVPFNKVFLVTVQGVVTVVL